MTKVEVIEQCKATFSKLDKDKNNLLSKEEYKNFRLINGEKK